MKNVIILEDSSGHSYGGGQKITLEVIKAIRSRARTVLLDVAPASIFFREACVLVSESFHYLHFRGDMRRTRTGRLLAMLLLPFMISSNSAFIGRIIRESRSRGEEPVIFSTTVKMMIMGVIAGLLNRTDVIYHAHLVFDRGNIAHRIASLFLRKVKRVICVSRAVEKSIDHPRSSVIYNPLISKPSVNGKKIRSGEIVVASISAVKKEKGIRYLLESLPYIKSNKVNIWVFGDGPDLESEKLRYSAERIAFKGYVKDVGPELEKNVSIVVMPSIIDESFGLALLDAFSKGIPVITTDIGGQKEISEIVGAGLLVPPRDHISIAQKIDWLIENPSEYESLSRKALANVDKFCLQGFRDKIRSMFGLDDPLQEAAPPAEKLKVLQVNKLYYPWIGGVEKVVQQISEGLAGKADVTVLACSPRGKGSAGLLNGVKVILAGSLGIFFSMPVSLSFPFLFKKESRNADILHFHMPFPLADICCLFFRPKGRIFIWWHSDIIKQRALMLFYRPVMRAFLRMATKIIVATDHHITSSKYLSDFKEKCVVVPFGVDLARYQADNKTLLEAAGIKTRYQKPLVLFVGRLVYYKGIEYLVEAMKEVDAILLIAGDGPLKERLAGIAAKSGISHKVEFLGRPDDSMLLNYYHACDMLAFPSVENSEAFGLVQIEAMACGKPVVSTNLPTGAGSVNVNGETGFVVPAKDRQALSAAINELVNSETLRLKMGEAAKLRVKKMYSHDKMISKVCELYGEDKK